MVEDVRYRVKTLIEAYDVPANITLDDDATAATYIVAYSDPQYPLKDVFWGNKNVDAIFSIEPFDSEPLLGFDKKPYAYREQVPITVYTVSKTGLTTVGKLENKCAQELRRIFHTYPTGSLRSVKRIRHTVKDMGGWNLYAATYVVDWVRAQENAAPTVPTFSHGIGWTFEGDREAGGAEGTWTFTQGAGSTCTDGVNSENNMYISCTVFGADSYQTSGTNLGLATNTYQKIRFRYKTTSDATAKIVVNFTAGSQTVLSESSSPTWTVVDVALTAGKTVTTIVLYQCDGVGVVTYDFVQIYKGDYILPNCVRVSQPFFLNDAIIQVPGRSGDITQALGTKLMEIRMTCDLSMEYSTVLWQRPQTTGVDDYNNCDIFLETIHNQGLSAQYPWVWLDVGSPAMQFKARLEEVNPTFDGDGDKVELVWREYRHGSAATESPAERFGLNL